MSASLESRIEQRSAALRMKFDRRVSLTSFAGCFVISSAYFLWLDPALLARLTGPGAFAFTLAGIPAVSLVFFFGLRIVLSPFVDGYYQWVRSSWNQGRAVAGVLAELLTAREAGYLDAAARLVRHYQPEPTMVLPVAHEAFNRLLNSNLDSEALELGERLGLPKDVLNHARRRMLADWAVVDGKAEPPQVAEAREAVKRLEAEYEAIDGLLRGFIAGELQQVELAFGQVETYAARLEPIERVPVEAMGKLFPQATVLRVAQVHLLMGQAYLQRGDRYQARTHLERSSELNPDDPQVRLVLSRVHYDQRNYPMAVAVIEAHLARFPEDLVAKFHWEDCVRSLGK
ncbi:MAG: tetratricopeptide repeat protein [Candidatus Wallbacteria bacterium]|nr:tetratricopeptide repeat protein [Candidatus Wallbacteria bacterium]